ncbi:zinc finger protein, partial [Oryctes borbonicus]
MDRIFKEEGVIDDDSMSEEETKALPAEARSENEVIGHMQSEDGEDLGELVVVNKNTNKAKVKPKSATTTKKKRKFECEICGRIFLHAGRLEVHKSFHKNLKYQCNGENCNIQMDSKQALEMHQQETGHVGMTLIESLDYGQIQLTQFNEPVQGNEQEIVETEAIEEEVEQPQLDENTENDEEPKITFKIVCQLCQKTFSCRQNYEVHIKAVHENQKPYKCDQCDKTFSYVNSLKCHMLQHVSEKTYPCESCDKVFNHPSSLVYHREAEHNNGRKFVCNKCNKSFKHKQLLLRHQLVHSNERPHSCKFCEATFKTRANLLNHMPMHTGEKKFFCNTCGQTFAHKTSLTLHIRWHNGQKPYECDVCLKTFSQKGNLAEHKRIHTGEKPYSCDHCGRKFTTSSQYKLHVKRHTGEKPWQCEYCAKQFLHKDTWKCHTRRHRNERPYQCQQCMRGFTEQWALKKHERLHTGEKPYACNLCHKSFADSSNLTKHKKIHTKMPQKEKVIKVITSEEDDKILYLTYEEGNSNGGEPQTFVHIMDDLDSPAVPLQNEQSNNANATVLPTDPLNISSKEELSNSLQLQQVIDNDGNPLTITTADNQNIKVVMRVDNGEQSIHGLLSDGTLVPINLVIQEGKGVTAVLTPQTSKDNKEEENITVDNEVPSQSPESSVEQLLDNNIHLLTEDGQKL